MKELWTDDQTRFSIELVALSGDKNEDRSLIVESFISSQAGVP